MAGQRRAQASTIAQIKVTTAVMGAMVARVDNGSRCLGQTLTELPLIEVLPREQRTFIKPLKYDARSAAAFPNVLLLDSGKAPLPLHVASPFAEANERALKASLVARCPLLWVWYTNQGMPPLPERTRYEAGGRVLHSSSQDERSESPVPTKTNRSGKVLPTQGESLTRAWQFDESILGALHPLASWPPAVSRLVVVAVQQVRRPTR